MTHTHTHTHIRAVNKKTKSAIGELNRRFLGNRSWNICAGVKGIRLIRVLPKSFCERRGALHAPALIITLQLIPFVFYFISFFSGYGRGCRRAVKALCIRERLSLCINSSYHAILLFQYAEKDPQPMSHAPTKLPVCFCLQCSRLNRLMLFCFAIMI